jgi:hypothetical protein
MKRYLLILSLSFFTAFTGFAQVEEADEPNATRLQEKMKLYIQKRLGLSKAEAQRFSPVFIRYIVELRRTHRENRQDKPMLQLKVAELRIRFRNEFRQIMDEQRANRVYEFQREFELKIVDEIKQRRLENQNRPKNRIQTLNREII